MKWPQNLGDILSINLFWGFTLPETNIAPENTPSQKEIGIHSKHPFSGAMLVSGRVDDFDLDTNNGQLWVSTLAT